ncbi:methyltransferase-like protein 27 isoform X2 [Simochromis diagramma]|uniref:methyltransferase-like protein 27 isoform X2 n=1 Tax=Simochromis diagramma TaxID=43689 RepID=UPI001A7E7E83|nr:methyltransferase-like protein 27 isoform X2 [Simochromis diagramma]
MSGSRRTVDDMRVMFQSCKGFDPQQTTDFYNSWAETYEQDLETMKYRAPQLAVDFLNDHFCGSRGDAQVLDVACGSGLAAKLMFDLGFKHFVGVDGSKGMLEQAAKSGLYRELKLALLGTDPLPAQTGGFDVVIITGALRDDYVPVSVIRELCKATKPVSRWRLTIGGRGNEASYKLGADWAGSVSYYFLFPVSCVFGALCGV